MAGVRDQQKRAAVRKLLRTKGGRSSSNHQIAREVGCSKTLVGEVRRQMIFDGSHPPIAAVEFNHPRQTPACTPGSKARGGYVYDERGRVVPELQYLLSNADAAGRKTARLLRQVLDELRAIKNKAK